VKTVAANAARPAGPRMSRRVPRPLQVVAHDKNCVTQVTLDVTFRRDSGTHDDPTFYVSTDALRSPTRRVELVERAYRKTERGRLEIATRANRLTHWLRCALILIDGRRTTEELTTMISTPAEEAIRELVDMGFIEPVVIDEGDASLDPLSEPTRTNERAAMLWLPMPQARRRALRCIVEKVGPSGAPLCRRIESAGTVDELHHALLLAERFVRRALGARRADAFERYVGLRPPRLGEKP
jgi:hypothetical protein